MGRRYLILYSRDNTPIQNIRTLIYFFKGVNDMKVWVCDECGKEVTLGTKPDNCDCNAANSFIEIDRADESGFGWKGPSA
jgi:ABC-type ATPase with predicted acetyltransferase domain